MDPEGSRIPESDWINSPELRIALIYGLADCIARLNYPLYDRYQRLEIPETEADNIPEIDQAMRLEMTLSDLDDANKMKSYCLEHTPPLKFPDQRTIDEAIKPEALDRVMKGDFNQRGYKPS